jgi:hypothetical protein
MFSFVSFVPDLHFLTKIHGVEQLTPFCLPCLQQNFQVKFRHPPPVSNYSGGCQQLILEFTQLRLCTENIWYLPKYHINTQTISVELEHPISEC